MFDPFYLLSSLILARSADLSLSVIDLIVECEFLNDKVAPPIDQPNDGSIFLSGFFIRRGKLVKLTDRPLLEADSDREYEYRLPPMKVSIRKKVYNNNLYTVTTNTFINHSFSHTRTLSMKTQMPSVQMALKDE